MNNTPPINATGIFEVLAPFELLPDTIYVCEAISGFEALESQGVDVFATYYTPNGLQQAKFDEDRKAGTNIITLMSADGPTVYIPSSFIKSFPSATSVPYAETVVSVVLGMLPTELNLDQLLEELKGTTDAYTGVASKVALHHASVKGFVDYDKHNTMEAFRRSNIKYTATTHKRLLQALEMNQAYIERIAVLEEALAALTP